MKKILFLILSFCFFHIASFSQSQSRLGLIVGYRFFDYPKAFENNGLNFILTPLYSLSGKRLELQTGLGLSLINIPNLYYKFNNDRFLEFFCYTIHISPNFYLYKHNKGIFSVGLNAEVTTSFNSYSGVGSWHVGNMSSFGITTLDYGINLSYLKEMDKKEEFKFLLIY